MKYNNRLHANSIECFNCKKEKKYWKEILNCGLEKELKEE